MASSARTTRDWAQRQAGCHPFLAHKTHILRDAWWQIYCRLDLDQPPRFDFAELDRDPFYRWLEATWRWQQPVALLFLVISGWGWVVWGVAARVAVANHGHWLVGHLAHNRGPSTGRSTRTVCRRSTSHGPQSDDGRGMAQ